MDINITSDRACRNIMRLLSAAVIASFTAACATTVQSGPYEITAYDKSGQVIRTLDVIVTDSRSLSVPMNALCINHPGAKLIARPQGTAKPIERNC